MEKVKNSHTADPATSGVNKATTEVGSVFVSNYPPYSVWSEDAVPAVREELDTEQDAEKPLGLYLHIPFCRKRCKFCYFKVYTGKNSDEISVYLDHLGREIEQYAEQVAVANRPYKYIYFGGGTPSFISVKHLEALVDRARVAKAWDQAEEIAFECEPGTLTESKLNAIRNLGVTRLSLGIEHFDDEILRENGRAHLSKEIHRVRPWIRSLDFAQVNIDLIAGMIGDTTESWKDTVEKAIDYDADSITIYQLELPHNAVYAQAFRDGQLNGRSIPDWRTKREWHNYAIDRLSSAGYVISSAYTMVKQESANKKFVYRDALWQGADMIPTGVASFGHLNGYHFQNSSSWDDYFKHLDEGQLPIRRAYKTTADERLVREVILQLKLGTIQPTYFEKKFGKNILEEFREPFSALEQQGLASLSDTAVELSREGFLKVDQLLPRFYAPEYQNLRYT